MSLFEGARNRRFIYSGPDDHGLDEHFIIASDLDWWLKNSDSVEQWLTQTVSHYEIGGCVITLPQQEDVEMFLLRWG